MYKHLTSIDENYLYSFYIHISRSFSKYVSLYKNYINFIYFYKTYGISEALQKTKKIRE